MSRFERDKQEIRKGNTTEIMKRRKKELETLWLKGKAEKNRFRMSCIAQDYNRLKAEYDELDNMI